MRIAFSKSVKYVPEWNGNHEAPQDERYTATLQPTDLATLIDMMDTFQAMGVDTSGKVETDKIDASTVKAILNQFGATLPKFVELTGLVDADDKPITVEDVVRYGPFMPLAMELLGKLAEISSPQQDDEKN